MGDSRKARGDDKQLSKLQRRPQRLDRLDLQRGVLGKSRHVDAEGEMRHGVHALGPIAQAGLILQTAPVRLGTDGKQLVHPGIAAGKAPDVMTGLGKLPHQLRADEAGGSGDEDAHGLNSVIYLGCGARQV